MIFKLFLLSPIKMFHVEHTPFYKKACHLLFCKKVSKKFLIYGFNRPKLLFRPIRVLKQQTQSEVFKKLRVIKWVSLSEKGILTAYISGLLICFVFNALISSIADGPLTATIMPLFFA